MCLLIHCTPMKLVSCIILCSEGLLGKQNPSGSGLILQHIRYNSECGVYEELEPIEKNLAYDFNFQQANHLPREIIIKPVS